MGPRQKRPLDCMLTEAIRRLLESFTHLIAQDFRRSEHIVVQPPSVVPVGPANSGSRSSQGQRGS